MNMLYLTYCQRHSPYAEIILILCRERGQVLSPRRPDDGLAGRVLRVPRQANSLEKDTFPHTWFQVRLAAADVNRGLVCAGAAAAAREVALGVVAGRHLATTAPPDGSSRC